MGFWKSVSLGAHSAPPAPPRCNVTAVPGSERQRKQIFKKEPRPRLRLQGRGSGLQASAPGHLRYPPAPASVPAWEADRGERLCRPVLHLQSPGDSAQSGLWGYRSRSCSQPAGVPVGVAGGWSLPLHPSLLFNPVPQYRDPRVHAWLVPLGAAFAPAHHAGLEDPPVCLHARQGAPGVALRGDKA